MAWVRCCGGTENTQYPIDLLANTWDTLPTVAKSVPAWTGVAYWNMIGKTPKLKNGATIVGTMNNSARVGYEYAYVQVSEDNSTWVTVITSNGTYGQMVQGDLSAYAGKELYIRCQFDNREQGTVNGIPIWHASNPVLQIL